MKTKEINGIGFEVIHSEYTDYLINTHIREYEGKDLYSIYEEPSEYKKKISSEWFTWYSNSDNVHFMEVVSGNCFTFTMAAIYTDENGEVAGYIKITKDHNRLYLKKGE